jgi:hypothetical protein
MVSRSSRWPNCAACGKPISLKDGWLSVNDLAAWKRHEEEMEQGATEDPMRVFTAAELMERYRPPVHWVWSHSDCDISPHDGYDIKLTQINTPLKALHMTLHLLTTKNWLRVTNWEDVMRQLHPEYPGQQPRRVFRLNEDPDA